MVIDKVEAIIRDINSQTYARTFSSDFVSGARSVAGRLTVMLGEASDTNTEDDSVVQGHETPLLHLTIVVRALPNPHVATLLEQMSPHLATYGGTLSVILGDPEAVTNER